MIVAIELSRCCRGQLQNLEPTNRLFCVRSRQFSTFHVLQFHVLQFHVRQICPVISCPAFSYRVTWSVKFCPAISCLAILTVRHFRRPIINFFGRIKTASDPMCSINTVLMNCRFVVRQHNINGVPCKDYTLLETLYIT